MANPSTQSQVCTAEIRTWSRSLGRRRLPHNYEDARPEQMVASHTQKRQSGINFYPPPLAFSRSAIGSRISRLNFRSGFPALALDGQSAWVNAPRPSEMKSACPDPMSVAARAGSCKDPSASTEAPECRFASAARLSLRSPNAGLRASNSVVCMSEPAIVTPAVGLQRNTLEHDGLVAAIQRCCCVGTL
jgi:hypothetical protein